MAAVLVTGATGLVGGSVVRHLAALGQQVIAAVRTPGNQRWPDGVAERAFEFGEPTAALADVLAGVDRVFLMRPPPLGDATALFPLIDAARAAGVRHLVFLSLQGVQFNLATPHHAVERYLRRSGVPFTALRPNFFLQNLATTYADDIRRTSELFVPAGRARTAFVDARDVGRVAARVLTEPGHLGRAYTLSGEQSLTYADVARTMSEVLGRPIHYARPTEAEYVARLRARGVEPDFIEVQRMVHRVVRLNVSALPNRSIRTLTGTPATTLAQFVSERRDVWALTPGPSNPRA